jgi:hypothetical protein
VDRQNNRLVVLMYYYWFRPSKLDLYLQQTSTQEKSELNINIRARILYNLRSFEQLSRLKSWGGLSRLQRWNLEFESSNVCRITSSCDLCRLRTSTDGEIFLDISEKDLVTRAGRLGGCRYNRFSLQVKSIYSDYLRVAILGNDASG